MKLLPYTFSIALLTGSLLAQTPANFSIPSTLPLEVYVQPSNISVTPGLLVQQSDALSAPAIIKPSVANANAYTAFMIDPGPPFLHWFQPNLIIRSSTNTTLDVAAGPSTPSTAVGAEYLYPMPPAGSGPHDYVILLFDQPLNWAVPSNYSNINPASDPNARFGFNIGDFLSVAGLGDLVGSNYFRVVNESAAATSTAMASQTGGGMSSSTATGSASASTSTDTSGASSVIWSQSIFARPVAGVIAIAIAIGALWL